MMQKILIILLLFTPTLLVAQNRTDSNGKKQGVWEKHYRNGKLMYKGHFKDGYPVGEMKRYHETGVLKAILIFTEKGKKSKAELFSEKGQLLAKGNFVNKQKDSIWNCFDAKKRVRVIESYANGKKDGENKYLFKNGNVSEVIVYSAGVKNGIWERYYPDGTTLFTTKYVNGKLHGGFIRRYKNGIIELSGNYKLGKKDGVWQYYSPKGKELAKVSYKNGVATNQKELDAKQQKALEEMEKQRNILVDPDKYRDNPDGYMQEIRTRRIQQKNRRR